MLDTLLPARPQVLWKTPAIVNFVLGGLGAGLYVVAAIVDRLGASPTVRLATWLGPALVAVGFAAVATEAGRPWRGIRVLRQVRTSWMSRELWLGGAFIALAAADLVAPSEALRLVAVIAAAGFALAQGGILRAARGIPAWNVSLMPTLFVASAALSGAGGFLLLEVLAGRTPGALTFGIALPLLPVGLVVWLHYLTWSDDAAFAAAVAPVRDGVSGRTLVAVGYVLPLVAGLCAFAWSAYGDVLAGACAVMIVGGQVRTKWVLLRELAIWRPITFAATGARLHPGRRS